MDGLIAFIKLVNGFVWGTPMLALILGTGLFLLLGLRLIPLRKLVYGFSMLWQGRTASGEGNITPFQALMTSLAATVGTGNIAGVATAVFTGGPGALFWMWCTALVGMATKYAEAVCAVKYRETNAQGLYIGGPMYYIKNGLGEKWLWLAVCFAFFGAVAGFGIGNGVQANSVANALYETFKIPAWLTGLVLMVLVGLVIIGGIKRIAAVAAKLVPFMAVAYLLVGIVILVMQIETIPAALGLVFKHAFTPSAAEGGFLGASVWMAIRFGVARGVFSNEAGLGSAPIAHAAAATDSPVRQGMVAMLGTFIDTIILCSVTGLVIISTGAYTVIDAATGMGKTGAALSSYAFESSIAYGGILVAFASILFAFTTLLGWSYYCERCLEYLVGVRVIKPFRLLWVLVIPLGASPSLIGIQNGVDFVWLLSDTLNALMALPNLIALILLSPVIFAVTREFFADRGTKNEAVADSS